MNSAFASDHYCGHDVCVFYVQPKKKKNISHDVFGTKYGRIHMQKQNLDKLQTRKMKGLKKRPADQKTEDKRNSKKTKLE